MERRFDGRLGRALLAAWCVAALGAATASGALPIGPAAFSAGLTSLGVGPAASPSATRAGVDAAGARGSREPAAPALAAGAADVRRPDPTPSTTAGPAGAPPLPAADARARAAAGSPGAAAGGPERAARPVGAVATRASTPGLASPAPATSAEGAAGGPIAPEVSRVSTSRPVVALTFDAGGDAGSTALTLRILRERGVHATMFVTGQFARSYPQLVEAMVADGHELANHTYDHRDLQRLSSAEIVTELEKTDAILRGFSGLGTKPLMRPPFGSRDTRVRRALAQAGYRSIYWTIDAGDWKPGATAAGVGAAIRRAAAGDIVVEHSASAATAAALPAVLDDLARRGLTVVTVSRLLGEAVP